MRLEAIVVAMLLAALAIAAVVEPLAYNRAGVKAAPI
jgi:hypothetical protein